MSRNANTICNNIVYKDCLTLNIWKPSSAKEQSKLPVVVYIHVRFRVVVSVVSEVKCREVAIITM